VNRYDWRLPCRYGDDLVPDSGGQPESMDFVRYVRVLRRRWRLIAVLGAVGMILGLIFAPRPEKARIADVPDTYLATHTLFSTSPNAQGPATLSLQQVNLLVKQGDVGTRVSARLGGDPAALVDSVVSIADTRLGTIQITATSPDPERAAELADVFAEELQNSVSAVLQSRIDGDRSVLTARLEQLEDSFDALAADASQVAQTQREAIAKDITKVQDEISALDAQSANRLSWTSLRTAEPFPATAAELKRLSDAAAAQNRGNRTNRGATSEPVLRAADVRSSGGQSGVPPLMGGLLGGMGGVVLGLIIVLLMSQLDPRIFTREDAEAAYGMPVIAEIPSFPRGQRKRTGIVSRDAPFSRFAEGFRGLRSAVLFTERHAPRRHDTTADGKKLAVVVMITSAGPAEGKTTTTSNLAAVLAEGNASVLVVNCDFRRPRLHLFLGGSDEPRRVVDTELEGVKLISGVVPNQDNASPAAVVNIQRQAILAAREHFDYIVLDTAPILTTSDACELLPISDMVIVIGRSGRTTKESADLVSELLERFEAPVVGVALAGVTDSPSSRYYYYYAREEPPTATDDSNPLAHLVGAPTARENGSNGSVTTADDDEVEAAAEGDTMTSDHDDDRTTVDVRSSPAPDEASDTTKGE
jgi:Mrp family chromosome partitioning ATPase/capsular polysaccharide biosynthesis protein